MLISFRLPFHYYYYYYYYYCFKYQNDLVVNITRLYFVLLCLPAKKKRKMEKVLRMAPISSI